MELTHQIENPFGGPPIVLTEYTTLRPTIAESYELLSSYPQAMQDADLDCDECDTFVIAAREADTEALIDVIRGLNAALIEERKASGRR